MFIELLRRDHLQASAEMQSLLDGELPIEQLQARTREIYSQLYRDNECFMNWTEARMMAARDAKFRTKLSALMIEKRSQIAEFIAYFYQRAGVPAPAAPEVMAMGFMSLVEGVKLFMLSSPLEMKSEQAETVLTLFVDSIMELARLQGEVPQGR
ncbi:MAG: TetR family transcriptional regulator C-terminal domain-containing protein [Pararobbsia sp.]